MGKQWKAAGKQIQSSKKGALFTRLSRAIQVSVRLGGSSNPENNHRLKLAIDVARSHSLPKDTIERAIQKGSGSATSDSIEEVLYEGFGPHGAAVLVYCLTDNRVRTVSEIRYLFKAGGGRMGESGSVVWMFDHVSVIHANIEESTTSTDDIAEETALSIGAEDIESLGVEEGFLFYGKKADLHHMQEALTKRNWMIQSADCGYRAKTPLCVDQAQRKVIQIFLSSFAEHLDCQHVYSNLSRSDSP